MPRGAKPGNHNAAGHHHSRAGGMPKSPSPATQPTAMPAKPAPSKPVSAKSTSTKHKGVGRGHGAHHHGPRAKKVK